MKKLLTLAIVLVVLAAFLDASMGQVKGNEGKAVERLTPPPYVPAPVVKPGPPSADPQRTSGGCLKSCECWNTKSCVRGSGVCNCAARGMGHGLQPPLPDPSPQRAACEAGCRQDYQGNPAAIEACYRRCGGPEATPARHMENQPQSRGRMACQSRQAKDQPPSGMKQIAGSGCPLKGLNVGKSKKCTCGCGLYTDECD
jgi:hypothetical protein